jgi:uncharacterized protein YcaQ
MIETTISKTIARRYLLGKQGLWPGRRWAGKEGAAHALQAIEAVQIDPINVLRQPDLVLHSRVTDCSRIPGSIAIGAQVLSTGQRSVYFPMSELPYWQ